MAPDSAIAVTELLVAWSRGDDSALVTLMPVVHAELRRLARREMRRERHGHTLQTTALVNEAYLRLVNVSGVSWSDRAHFFAMSARIMRRILVDHARSRRFLKRGGAAAIIGFDEELARAPERAADLIALDDALEALGRIDERKARVVELRFFGGLSVEESAAALGVSPGTVMRDWRLARAWLLKHMSDGADRG